MDSFANQSQDRNTLPRADDVSTTCRCADWYAEGESRVVEFGEFRVVVHFVGRKGRRGRIVIEAPAGAEFH